MRFDVVTLFPELFVPFLATGITRRAYSSGLVDVHFLIHESMRRVITAG